MSMTRLERGTKYAIAKILNKQGYPKYADIFMKFDLHFHNPPGMFAAAVDADKGIIYLNPTITDRDDVSVLIRHEILHTYLAHQKRMLVHFAKMHGLEWKDIDDIPLEAILNMTDNELNALAGGIKQDVITDKQIAKDLYGKRYKSYPYHNYLKDLEISNRGYTEKDKDTIRNLKINGISASGLITDDLEPDLVGLSLEDMMDVVENKIEDETEELDSNEPDENDTSSSDDSSSEDSENSISNPDTSNEDSENSKPGTGGSSQNNNADVGGESSDQNPSGGDSNAAENDDENSKSNSSTDNSNSKGDSSTSSSDINLDDLNWSDIKNNLEEIMDNIDQLSDEEKQSLFNELRSHMDEVNKDVLEKENEERQKQIEQETDNYNPDDEDSEARLQEIADMIEDESTFNELMDETDSKVYQSRAEKHKQEKQAKSNAEQYSANNSVKDFILDLNKLIKKEVSKIKSKSWGKINKKADGTGVMKPGKTTKKNPDIPKLYVYFDMSGSWGPEDHKVGEQAIETLNTYVKKKQLVIDVFYFADSVSTSPDRREIGGGTGAGKELVEHIAKNKPDNVCIMTDDDFDAWGEITEAKRVLIPGGVFLLFRRGKVSHELVKKVRGRRLNKIYKF